VGTRSLYGQVVTNKSFDEVKKTAASAFMMLGGTLVETPDGFQISNGANGVNFGFTAKFTAWVRIREVKAQHYDLECVINWSPAPIVWICLVVGLFIFGILWLVALLYLFVNPGEAYQQALFRTQQVLAVPSAEPRVTAPAIAVDTPSTAPAEPSPAPINIPPSMAERTTIYCTKCGAANTADGKFCMKCGAPLV
jgi:hypothetical protein